MQRTRFILILIPVLAILLTGCAARQTARASVEDPWGVVTVPPGEPIRLLSVTALDETVVGGEGLEQLRGAQLATAGREVSGFGVEWIEQDGGCESGRAAGRAVNDTLDRRIAAAVGYSCSTACSAAVSAYETSHFTMVSPACGASDLVDPVLHLGAFVRLSADDALEAKLAAQFAYEQLGARSAVIIHDGTSETQTHAATFDAAFTDLGGTIAASLSVEQGVVSFGSTLSRTARHNPDVIYAPLLLPDGAKLAYERGMSTAARAALIGGRRMASAELVEVAGTPAERIYAVAPSLAGEAGEIARQYEEQYGEPPASAAYAFGYDAASLLLNAIEQVAVITPDGSLQFGRQALRDALYTTAAYPGVTGHLTCTEWGDCSAGRLAVHQVQKGEWTAVYAP